MKKIYKYILLIIMSVTVSAVFADPPNPPDPGGQPPSTGGVPVGGAASIEDNVLILIVLSLIYLGYRIWYERRALRKKLENIN